MDIVKLLQDLSATITSLQSALADAQAAAESIAKEAYDKGFADGVASVPPVPTDKIYSQEDLDAAVKAAAEPLQARVAELEAQVADMPAAIDAKVAEAMAAFKADLLAKYEAQQADESAGESAIREMLK